MTNPPFVPYPVKTSTDPVLAELFKIANERRVSRHELSRLSGVAVHTIRNWEDGSRPRIDMIGYCFTALGYELKPVNTRS